jgi:putative Holliday junction resolvase
MIFTHPTELLATLKKNTRLMGLDVGEKTIGLAISDVSRMIASPLLTIARKNFKSDYMQLKEQIDKHDVSALIIGYPINMNGSEGPRCQSIRQFVRNVEERTPIATLLYDERMSTMAVNRTMLDADMSRQRRSELVDKLAAGYILQGFLDTTLCE